MQFDTIIFEHFLKEQRKDRPIDYTLNRAQRVIEDLKANNCTDEEIKETCEELNRLLK